ncbi:hypothetical protein ACNQGB_07475 [Flavobacterium sp. XS1P32]|uniref:hypothetical protein n=1 Tax=Flavobacterium sp. XS1P32 TaxID=3401726 RepID=UPI003AADFD5D
MNIKKEHLTKGFILAGLMNISGVLLFSRFFSNAVIPEFDPQAMSNFGLMMIVVWGFAYIAVSQNFDQVKWLIAVFMIEKLIYATHWTKWILDNKITDVLEKDKMAGIFYVIYGINDWMFFLFFFFVFISVARKKI